MLIAVDRWKDHRISTYKHALCQPSRTEEFRVLDPSVLSFLELNAILYFVFVVSLIVLERVNASMPVAF
jgi:hypothetical protein